MDFLQTRIFAEKPILYDGTQLRAHWIYRNFDLLGDSLIAFQGPADVNLDHMVDLEDVKKKAPIYSPRMLHFLGEWFCDSLERGILLQHLFVCQIYETLLEKGIPNLYRRGNDIYFDSRKMSVSVATRSLVSVLLHVGINIETEGTPIPTSGLNEIKIKPDLFAAEILERFSKEYAIYQQARLKVLSV